jgi:DNA-nicking Smr family endonuclease
MSEHPRRRPKGLSAEDAALWDQVAHSARAMHPKRKVAKPAEPKKVPEPRASHDLPAFRVGEKVASKRSGHMLQPGLSERLAGQPIRMDRKTHTRMQRGKLRPEAKIDLHGMTLAEAHPRLTAFVLRANAEGKRLILVVTGKGRDRDDGGPIPTPRGALKNQVPMWLGQAPVAALVLQVTEAHRSHGGAGAYYVYLRRPPGLGPSGP